MATKLENLDRVLAFLKLKGLTSLPFNTIAPWYGSCDLSIERKELTDENLRLLKRIFGPFTFADSFQGKDWQGKVLLDETEGGYSINLTISRAYACEFVEAKDLDEAAWDRIKQQAREGRIKLQDCKPIDGAESAAEEAL